MTGFWVGVLTTIGLDLLWKLLAPSARVVWGYRTEIANASRRALRRHGLR